MMNQGYRLIKCLVMGFGGEVWRAEGPGGILVAIKIVKATLPGEAVPQEVSWLELIKGLCHPFLLTIQSSWVHEGRLFLVMELADGSLRDWLMQNKRASKSGIPLRDLLRYLCEAAAALDYLHAMDLVHRGVKPDSILLVGDHAKVAGLSHVQRMPLDRAAKTTSGTPAYMAPEVWTGAATANSDQYALACAYAELRLERLAFAGPDLMTLMRAHLQDAPDLAPLPPAEQAVLVRALAKNPDQRFASCQEFTWALTAAALPGAG
jgi:serine/threonine protein kinase